MFETRLYVTHLYKDFQDLDVEIYFFKALGGGLWHCGGNVQFPFLSLGCYLDH